jgi:hypothetical protein
LPNFGKFDLSAPAAGARELRFDIFKLDLRAGELRFQDLIRRVGPPQ